MFLCYVYLSLFSIFLFLFVSLSMACSVLLPLTLAFGQHFVVIRYVENASSFLVLALCLDSLCALHIRILV